MQMLIISLNLELGNTIGNRVYNVTRIINNNQQLNKKFYTDLKSTRKANALNCANPVNTELASEELFT